MAGPTEYHITRDIDEHVGLIARQVERSLRDAETRRLAVKIVSNKVTWRADPARGRDMPFIDAWGKWFPAGNVGATCPPREDECEVIAIWNFVVTNCRYVYDPTEIDMFVTTEETLKMGGGDCFPVDTLVLREDGRLVPISTVQVGDRIHDGTRFVEVLKTWDRGPKEIVRAALSNGSTLRLSGNHKILRVPRADYVNPNTGAVLHGRVSGHYSAAEECLMADLRLEDDLLQPREFGGGGARLSEDDAFLVGAYLAEGCKYGKRRDEHGNWERDYVSLAGVANRKMVRERVAAILTSRGVPFTEYERELRFRLDAVPVLANLDLGDVALEKRLPHLDWHPETVAHLVAAMEQGDAGLATNEANTVFSTVSLQLALQYRVLKRMLGHSTHMKTLAEHGGAGENPIHRVTVRVDDVKRPWARVRSLLIEPNAVECCDLMTESGRVYLPEADVIVHNCDDMTIVFASLLKAIGFQVRARVISTTEAPDEWAHIYPLVGLPKDKPREWRPLDATVKGAKPGWQYNEIAMQRDYRL